MPKHEEQSPSRRDFLIQMFEDVYNVYNGFKHLHIRRYSEPLGKAILRARTVVLGFDDMPNQYLAGMSGTSPLTACSQSIQPEHTAKKQNKRLRMPQRRSKLSGITD